MAVSHQWFIQWSAPSMIFADIMSQYKSVNERLNSFEPAWNNISGVTVHDDTDYNYSNANNDEELKNSRLNYGSREHYRSNGKIITTTFTISFCSKLC